MHTCKGLKTKEERGEGRVDTPHPEEHQERREELSDRQGPPLVSFVIFFLHSLCDNECEKNRWGPNPNDF